MVSLNAREIGKTRASKYFILSCRERSEAKPEQQRDQSVLKSSLKGIKLLRVSRAFAEITKDADRCASVRLINYSRRVRS